MLIFQPFLYIQLVFWEAFINKLYLNAFINNVNEFNINSCTGNIQLLHFNFSML